MGVKKKKDSKRNGISREQEQRSSGEGGTTSVRADCPEDVVVKVRMRKEVGNWDRRREESRSLGNV